MCAGALVHARLRRVVFGCLDARGGAAGSLLNILQMPQLNHRCEIAGGVRGAECGALLREFFAARRGAGRDVPPDGAAGPADSPRSAS